MPRHCPFCLAEIHACEVSWCPNTAEYEGWYRVLDNFTLQPTGLVRLARVCGEHLTLLIGGQSGE
jgi:hypothetical protein